MFRLFLISCLAFSWVPLKAISQTLTTPTAASAPQKMTPTAVPRVPFKEELDNQLPADPSDGLGFIPPVLDTATPTNLSLLQASLAVAATATPVTTPIPVAPIPAGTPMPVVLSPSPTAVASPAAAKSPTSGK